MKKMKKDAKWLEFKAETAKLRSSLMILFGGPIIIIFTILMLSPLGEGLMPIFGAIMLFLFSLIMIFTHKISSLITYMLRNTKISPNMVTIASFIVFLIGMPFFLYKYNDHNFWYLITASAIVLISYILYCAGKELTLYKKIANPLWEWLNSIFDRLKEAILFSIITLYAFLKYVVTFPETAAMQIMAGFVAFINVSIVRYINSAKNSLNIEKPDYFIKIGKKYTLSYTELIIAGIAVAALFDRFEFILMFFMLIGPVFWITQIIMLILKHRRNS